SNRQPPRATQASPFPHHQPTLLTPRSQQSSAAEESGRPADQTGASHGQASPILTWPRQKVKRPADSHTRDTRAAPASRLHPTPTRARPLASLRLVFPAATNQRSDPTERNIR